MTGETRIWPQPNPAADTLLAGFLDRVSPGWAARPRHSLTGDEILRQLWKLAPMFEGQGTHRIIGPLSEIEVDTFLTRMAKGVDVDLGAMTPGGKAVLHARFLTAASAAAASLSSGPLMILPGGLTEDQLMKAALVRLLYQAPLSIDGLG